MEKNNCNIIKDILPLYADNVVSDDTKTLILEHLAICAECKAEYEKMKEIVEIPAETNTEPLKQIKEKMSRKRMVTICVTALITTVVVMGLAIYLYAPVIFQRGNPFPYLYAATKINDDTPFVEVNVNNNNSIYISRRGTCDEILLYIAESKNLEFQEQAGSAFLFSNGEKTLAVSSEVYWAKYTVWTVPAE